MRFLRTILLLWVAIAVSTATAQVTTSPALLQMSSTDVTIYFHADQGTQGLMGQPSSAAIYAHTGVILEGSSDSEWTAAPKWLDNSAKYKLEYAGPNLWALHIGDIRTYYGLDADAKVAKLAFVFRNATGSLEGKATGGKDIFADVLPEGFQIRLTASPDGTVITPEEPEVTFTAVTTKPAAIAITINRVIVASAESASELSTTFNFSEPGSYTIEAKAATADATAEASLSLAYLEGSEQRDYPGGVPQMGAKRASDGSVLFCLAAPQKKSAVIVGAWDDYNVRTERTMFYQDYEGQRYFWIAVEGLKKDVAYPYYYLVDNTIRVGDPYARLVLDPEFDSTIPASVYPDMPTYPADKVGDVCLAVYQENLNDYNWTTTNFKGASPSTLNIYELLIRDFTGTEGKALGNGTVKAAIEKIPYLKNLGINVVELLPICEFNGNISWGYNPNFYFAPDKAYGTPDDYKRFIDACHAEGIAVVLDMVFNQSDWKHPWYKLYTPGSNPFYNADAPHAYSVLNDWNQGNALVQQQWDDAIRYWLTEYRFDGFRFDLVKGLGDNDSYANASDGATNAYNASRIARMIHFAEVARSVNPDAYIINEDLAGAEEENKMAESGLLNWANLNTQGRQYAIGQQANSGLRRFYAPFDSRIWGSTVSYLESHDEQRLAYSQTVDGATGIRGNVPQSMRRLGAAAAQMIMAPGAHMVWQFSELGNDQTTKSGNNNNTDPKTVLWSYFDNPDRHGLYESYAELFAIRSKYPQLFASDVVPLSNTGDNFWSGGRTIVLTKESDQLIMAANPNATASVTVAANFATTSSADFEIVSKSYNTDPTFDAAKGTITLEPNAYVVLARKSKGAVDSTAEDTARLRIAGLKGALEIATAGEAVADINVFATTGERVAHIDMLEGSRTIPLPAGVYIVRAGTDSYKAVVR